MPRSAKNITGKVYGELKVIKLQYRERGHHFWLCECSCGRTVTKRKHYITTGGHPYCLNPRHNGPPKPAKKKDKFGLKDNPEIDEAHAIWSQAKQRCFNPNNLMYASFKQRGITMCPEWKADFGAFLKDMGPRPGGRVLGRVDVTKGYNKENCRWLYWEELNKIQTLLK